MKLRIDHSGPSYIAVMVEDAETAVLRRYPWPNNIAGKRQKLNEAKEYANSVGRVLLCPIETDIGLEIALECARLGITGLPSREFAEGLKQAA